MPRPPLKSPVQQGRSVGTDHGIAVAITAVDDEEHVWRFQHDLEAAAKSNRRIRRQEPRMSQCHQGSRRRKRRKNAVRRLRGKVSRRRQQRREAWAHELVTRHDTVCVEKLAAGNMTRGARDPGRAGDERRPEGGADWRRNRRPT